MVHPGQHVMQAVAEFVKQGGDLIVSEQGGFIADGRGEVTG